MRLLRLLALFSFGLLLLAIPSAGIAETFTVDANLNCISRSPAGSGPTPTLVDTGIDLIAGDVVTGSASGTWTISGSDPLTDADGQVGRFSGPWWVSSLLGQISDTPRQYDDPDDDPGVQERTFFLGKSFSIRAPRSGRLFLAFNDTDYGNNAGSVSVSLSIVRGTIITGRVSLQGLDAAATPRPVTFEFRPEQGEVVAFTQEIGAAGAEQEFKFAMPPGVYTLAIKGANYLRASTAVNVQGTTVVNLPAVTLPVGDISGDNKVNLTDLVRLRQNYGKTGLGLIGDLNGDGKVNLTDLVLLRGNYGRVGAP